MPRLGRAVRDLCVVERASVEQCKRRRGSGGDETVEQNGNVVAARSKGRAKNSGKLTAAEDHARGERIFVMRPVAREPDVDCRALPRQTGVVEACAAPGPALAAAAEQRRGKR